MSTNLYTHSSSSLDPAPTFKEIKAMVGPACTMLECVNMSLTLQSGAQQSCELWIDEEYRMRVAEEAWEDNIPAIIFLGATQNTVHRILGNAVLLFGTSTLLFREEQES